MSKDDRAMRILVVEDHPLLAEGIRAVLVAQGHECVGLVASLEAAARTWRDLSPDALVVDIELPDGSGLALVRECTAAGIACIVLSAHEEPAYVREALRAGARGFVHKGDPPSQLLAAIDALGRGERALSSRALDSLSRTSDVGPADPLSRRELEVLRHLAEGLTNKEVGKLLFISPRTVETHRENIMRKLGARGAADLVRAAIVMGLVKPGSE